MSNDALDTTVDLLARFRAGDERAKEILIERCVPPLRRWARGRLPGFARSLCDTQDLVQDAVLRSLPRLVSFDPRGRGALLGFLRRAVHNQVIDEVRKAQRRPEGDVQIDTRPDPAPSPLQQAMLQQDMNHYRAGLATLCPRDQAMIRARFEDTLSYDEIAARFGKPNANAARVAVTRAIARLLRAMAQ